MGSLARDARGARIIGKTRCNNVDHAWSIPVTGGGRNTRRAGAGDARSCTMKLVMKGPHAIDVATLRQRVDERVGFYDKKYPNISLAQYYRWLDETHARAEYRGGSATVILGESDVAIEMDLPFFARLYKGRIEEFARAEIELVTRPR